MTILNRLKTKSFIDISGPDALIFALMGAAEVFAKRLGMDPKPIINEMMFGDYENLLKVFDKNFGEYVDLYR